MGGVVINIRTSHAFCPEQSACCTDVQRVSHDTQRHPRLGLKHAFRGMQAACKKERRSARPRLTSRLA